MNTQEDRTPHPNPESFDGDANEWLWAGLRESDVLAGTIRTPETAVTLLEMAARLLIGPVTDEACGRALPLLRDLADRVPAIVAGHDTDFTRTDRLFDQMEAGLAETWEWLSPDRHVHRAPDGTTYHVAMAASLLAAVKAYIDRETLSTRMLRQAT